MKRLAVFLLSVLSHWSYRKLCALTGITGEESRHAKWRNKKVNGFTVTEHAVIRYLERLEGHDIDHIRSVLASSRLRELAGDGRTGEFIVGDITVVVSNKTIITVYPHTNGIMNNIRGLDKIGMIQQGRPN